MATDVSSHRSFRNAMCKYSFSASPASSKGERIFRDRLRLRGEPSLRAFLYCWGTKDAVVCRLPQISHVACIMGQRSPLPTAQQLQQPLSVGGRLEVVSFLLKPSSQDDRVGPSMIKCTSLKLPVLFRSVDRARAYAMNHKLLILLSLIARQVLKS